MMENTIPQAFFAYPSRSPLEEAIHDSVSELNEKKQVKIKTWEECEIGGTVIIDTICDAIDEAELFLADLTGLNANVMFELGYALACGKRIWLILDDSYTEQQNMFEQLKILTTVGYVSCNNSQHIVSGFYKDKPFADIDNTIFRAPIEPNLKPDSILYLKSQHENQAAMRMSNLLQERFPEKITVDVLNKPSVQSLADYGNLVFGCNGLVCHFTNPERNDAYLQTARHSLICGMAHGFEKPLLMLAEGEFLSPIDYRDYLKHYNTATEALSYLKKWLPHVEQDLKVAQEATVVPRLKIFITYSHEDADAKDKLRKCLAVMEQQNKLATWHDGDITAGSNARQEHILKEVANSDILLYLVSTNSLASENCNKELTEAIRVGKRVIPVILESCDWLNNRLRDFQVLPDKGKPINKWEPESDGWQNVVDGIREVVEEMLAQTDSLSMTSEKEQRVEYAEVYFNRGDAYHRKGDFDLAIGEYTKAIELKLDYTNAYNNRGVAYYNKGDYEKAIVDFNRAIDLRPDDAKTYFGRGDAYADRGEFDKAINDYNTALGLNSGFALVYYKRAVVWLRLRQWDKAGADLTIARHMRADIITVFRHDYESVADFERRNEINLPADLAAMLTP